jgi:hypothetical protein
MLPVLNVARSRQVTGGMPRLHIGSISLIRTATLRGRLMRSSDDTPLTQEFISHMLGVRRTSVSLSAHALQRAGLIRYSRGHIKILSRDGLKESACECYEVVREHFDKIVPPPS